MKLITNVSGCARCGEDHKGVEFEELARHVQRETSYASRFTHWSPCPVNDQPILLRVDVENE